MNRTQLLKVISHDLCAHGPCNIMPRSGNFLVKNLSCKIFNTDKMLRILYTLHVQAVMASAIEHVHRRACCVRGSVLADFRTKTSTVVFIRSMILLVTADSVLEFSIVLCYSSGRYGGGECPCRIG